MKKPLFIIISLLCVFSLVACQGYREVDSEYLISAICFDKIDKEFCAFAEVLAIEVDEKASKNKVFSAQGKTPYEAVNNIAALLPKTAVFDHCAAAVISEKITGSDLKTVLKYLYDTKNLNLGIYLFLCSNIKELLDCKSQTVSVGYDIMDVERNIEKTSGIDFKNKYYEIESRIADVGGFCVPVAKAENSHPEISGQTVFTDYNPVITLNKNEAIFYNLLYSGSAGGAISVNRRRCRVNSVKSDITEKENTIYVNIYCNYRQRGDSMNNGIKGETEKLLNKIKGTSAIKPLGVKANADTVYVRVKGNGK